MPYVIAQTQPKKMFDDREVFLDEWTSMHSIGHWL